MDPCGMVHCFGLVVFPIQFALAASTVIRVPDSGMALERALSLVPLAVVESNPSATQSLLSRDAAVAGNRSRLPKRFLLHHIWKCGGRHMCRVAEQAGFVVPQNVGCHRFVDDSTPVDAKTADFQPCAVGRPGLADLPFDVIGHECAISESILTNGEQEGFAWVGVVRDPVEQALSWFAFAKQLNETYLNMSFEGWLKVCTPDHPCGFFTFEPNLQTRWLAGGKCLNSPEDEDCVEIALTNLGRMAAVLEQSGGNLLGREKLEMLGWDLLAEPPYNGSGARAQLHELLPGEREHIEKLQYRDIELLYKVRAAGMI